MSNITSFRHPEAKMKRLNGNLLYVCGDVVGTTLPASDTRIGYNVIFYLYVQGK